MRFARPVVEQIAQGTYLPAVAEALPSGRVEAVKVLARRSNGEDGLTLEGDPTQAGLKTGDSIAILPTLEEYLGQPMGQIIADNLSRFEEQMQREWGYRGLWLN